MKKMWLCFLFAVVNGLFAQNVDDDADWELFDFAVSRENGVLTPPPAAFNPIEATTFNPQLPKVNVITGEYCEEECDLIIAGAEPLSYRRFYGNQGYKDEGYGHWRINPECLFLFNFETRDYPKYGAIGSENGSFSLYEHGAGNVYGFNPHNKSFTNGADLTGQHHPLNTRISYNRVRRNKNETYFCHWEGVIEEGDGRKRFFKSDWKMWPQEGFGTQRASAGQNFIPPYQAKILEDRKPNGNIIRYTYEDYNGPEHYSEDYGSTYYVLSSIAAYSAKGVFLGSLNINYKRLDSKRRGRRVDSIHVGGSDGRQSHLYHNIREVQCEK